MRTYINLNEGWEFTKPGDAPVLSLIHIFHAELLEVLRRVVAEAVHVELQRPAAALALAHEEEREGGLVGRGLGGGAALLVERAADDLVDLLIGGGAEHEGVHAVVGQAAADLVEVVEALARGGLQGLPVGDLGARDLRAVSYTHLGLSS